MLRFLAFLTVLLVFGGWSTWLSIQTGYWGFLDIALEGQWGTQVFLDLAISLFLLCGFLRHDAKKHDLPFWPYLVAVPFLGCISPLTYMVHREWKRMRSAKG